MLERLRTFYLHPDWQLRHQVVTALRQLIERGVVSPEAVAGDVDDILATSPSFDPAFPLRDNLRELGRAVRPQS